MKRRPLLTAIKVILLIVAIVFTTSEIVELIYWIREARAAEKRLEEASKGDVEAWEKAEASFSIPADDLYRAYGENRIAADQRYKNQTVVVSGIVGGVSVGGQYPDPIVALRVGSVKTGVLCDLDRDQLKEAAALKPGQRVVIEGKCEGVDAGVLIIRDCVILRPGG